MTRFLSSAYRAMVVIMWISIFVIVTVTSLLLYCFIIVVILSLNMILDGLIVLMGIWAPAELLRRLTVLRVVA